jgi:gliding motility-associated-like protein
MKKLVKSVTMHDCRRPVVFSCLAVFLFLLGFLQPARACSPLLVPTLVSQNINGTNLELSWSSNTTYNCQYYVDVEIVCNNVPFPGNGNPPFISSATITKTSTPFPYPLQSISISNLCPGTTYQFRAREVEFGNSSIFSSWTSTFTFTTPGTFIPPVATAAGSPYLICVPGQSQLSCTLQNACGGTPPAYSWAPATNLSSTSISNPVASPTATTTYTCFVTGGYQGCWVAQDTVQITCSPASNASAGPPVSFCIGGSAVLNGTGGGTYQWAPATGLSSTTVANPTASPTVTTTYTVTVTQGLCSSSATVLVTVYPLPVVSFSGIDTTGCAPLTVTFSNNTPNSANCSWDFGNTATLVSCTNPLTYTYGLPGTYSVLLTVTDNNGCVASSTHTNMVTVYAKPQACFTFGPQPATTLDPTIHFADCSSGAVAWDWSFGDPLNSTSHQQNPTFAYPDSGSYTVRQIVCNSSNCCDTTYATVEIGPYFSFYIPNAFTPGKGVLNNEFYPQGVGMDKSTYHFWIFDRWGNCIFETTDWNTHWDGKNRNGKLVEEDVYVWYITFEDYMHAGYEYVGHVSVIR